METLFSTFRMNFWKQWGGKEGQSSTSQSSATDSSSKKLMSKLADLLLENERLKEELRLRDLYDNREYDV